MANVVVVGAGFAGLSAAVRLAKAKHAVTLVEATERVGGRLRRIDGQWAHSPESMTLPGVVRDLFRKSGRTLDRHLEITEAGPRRHVFVTGRRVDALELPFGRRGDQHDAIVGLVGRDDWSPWLDGLDPWWDPLRRHVLEQVMDSPPDRSLRKTLALRTSLERAVKKGLSDDRLRRMVLDPHRLGGDAGRTVPAVAAVSHLVERRFARWTFDGGLEPLADVLEHRLTERRITLERSTPVTDVEWSGDRVTGVRTAGGSLGADHVVWCAPTPPASWPTPAVLPRIPARRTHVRLAEGAALPQDLWVHAGEPMHVWAGAPGCWTIEHHAGTEPLGLLAAAGHRVRDAVVEQWTQSPAEVLGDGHHGWAWSGWRSFTSRPGFAPPAGLTFAGAHAHLGPSLELVGMGTSILAAHLADHR